MFTGAAAIYQRLGQKPAIVWLIASLAVLLVTGLSIFFGVPVLAPVLGFLVFTILPGLAILYILKVDQVDYLERLLLSVGMSLVFLIVVGLVVNLLYPLFGYSTPLSIPSLAISNSVAAALLCLGGYFRNKEKVGQVVSMPSWPKDKLLWPLVLSAVFPLLSILGTQLMGAYGDNRVLLLLFFLVPIYIVLLILLRKRVWAGTYPVAIGMISIALLLTWGLTSDYLIGGDIYVEYLAIRATLEHNYWSISDSPDPVSMSLGISLLSAIYSQLLRISAVYTLKVVILLLTTVVPLSVYVLSRRFLDPLYSFLASCFFMVQLPFINVLPRVGRVDIALIFFALALVTLLKLKVSDLQQRTLFIVFGLALAPTYYMTPLLLFILVLALWVASPLIRRSAGREPFVQGTTVALFATAIFVWWGQITSAAFTSYVNVVMDMAKSVGRLTVSEMEGTWVAGLYQISGGYLRITRVILQHLVNALVGIGVIYAIFKRKKLGLDVSYLVVIAASLLVLTLYLVSPLVSMHYGGDRLFIQILVVLSPAFIIGCLGISLSKSRLTLILISVLLVSQFFVSTFTADQIMGIPSSVMLNREGTNHDTSYIYKSEVAAAQWLSDHTGSELNVEIDFNPKPRTGWLFEFVSRPAGKHITVESGAFTPQQHNKGSYLFLRYANIVNGWVYQPRERYIPEVAGREPLAQHTSLLSSRNKIYSNGNAEIYR